MPKFSIMMGASQVLLAQVSLNTDWSDALKVLVGFIGILCIVSLIFGLAIQWKKLFGRRPPIGDELDKLEGRLHAEILESHSRAFAHADAAMKEVTGVRAQMEINHRALTDAGAKREDVLRDHMDGVRRDLEKVNADIWSEMRKEDKEMRTELADKFASFQRLLGRIEQKIDQHL